MTGYLYQYAQAKTDVIDWYNFMYLPLTGAWRLLPTEDSRCKVKDCYEESMCLFYVNHNDVVAIVKLSSSATESEWQSVPRI